MRLTAILIAVLLISGCAFHQPLVAEQVQVAGKAHTYVAGQYRVGILGDKVTVVDRYDDQGKLEHPADITTTGTIHDTLKAAGGNASAAAVLAPIETPIINGIEGK